MNSSQNSIHKMFALLVISIAVACRYSDGSPVQARQTSLMKLADANNYFAWNLHRRLVANAAEENVIFSPLSVSMAFGMLLLGARNDTAEEISKALGYERVKLPDELVHLTFKDYWKGEQMKNSSKGYTLNIANAILVDERLPLLSDYRNAARTKYGAPAQNMDFANNAPKVKDGINEWVNSKTKGKIERLLDELSADTVMVILNAVYFKGLWKIPFNSILTSDKTFYNNGQDSLAKEVPTMNMWIAEFPFTSTQDYRALEMPYEGNVSMLIILPNERNGLPALEASMTLEQFNSIRRSMKLTEAAISLPKFRIDYTKNLNEELEELGMQKIFHSNTADFSGISPAVGLAVSDVTHKAFVNVDEIGTEAAAITSIMFGLSRIDNMFLADHPFLFAIFDTMSGMILFLGRVNSL